MKPPGGEIGGMEQPARRPRRRGVRVSCSKILSWYELKRNRVTPIRCRQDEPGCEYLTVGPRRTLRILRPELNRAGRYYEPPPDDRRESLNDNFYLRWAKRPHPSGNCRCSFRQSSASRLSTHEEIVISKEIQRIRTSLCEAEKSGRDIEDVEKSLEKSLDLSQLHEQLESPRNRIDRLDEPTRRKIVQDLDRYISDLLDEILNDTIRAIARAENPFSKADFDITFSFHNTQAGPEPESAGGYVNRGFVGSASDPDALDENADCTDSGINSVETIELQPPEPADQNLEQSLMDIIDAKLGGSTIGKSLENLGMEIDEDNNIKTVAKVEEEPPVQAATAASPEPTPTAPSSTPKPAPAKKPESPKPTSPGSVTSKVNRTVTAIRRRIATKLRCNSKEPPPPETRASLKLEDYRRRFLPQIEDEVTLRGNSKRKPTIVFLHGFGSTAESFSHQLSYFAGLGYPCIAPDLLGHGMSSAPRVARDYKFDKLLTDLELVLLRYALKPGHKCVIVAHNYGCSFATALASKYSANIHQLVLISGGGPTPLAPPLREGAAHCCLRASLAPLLVCGMNRTVLYSARGRQHPYCGGDDDDGRLPSHMEHVRRGMSWPDGDYVFHRRICTPTLLVHGLRDNKVSLVQECQMERTMVKAFLEAIPVAGHMPMTDCPEQLNHMIRCFIDLWKNKKW